MLIAITGKSGSAKSTALNILKQRYNTLDLDQFCKSLNLPSKPIEEIFESKESLTEYCQQFSKPIKEFLSSYASANKWFLVEASALHVYPELKSLFHKTIKIELDSNILESNRKNNIRRYDLLDKTHELFDNQTDYTIHINSNSITEIISKLEFQILYITNPNKQDQLDKIYKDYNDAWDKNTDNKPYHNRWHTLSVINSLIPNTDIHSPLFQVAIWHDYVSDPNMAATYVDNEEVAQLIRLTDYANIDDNQLKEIFPFLLADTSHWLGNYHEIIEVEKQCFKEYQNHDYYSGYRPTRIKILNWLKTILPEDYQRGIQLSIDFLMQFQPKIGWFCGSFNPFHIGHANILHKAELVFDKVVIVKAINPNKTNSLDALNINLPNEIIYTTNIPESLKSIQYRPTLIRGIRNSDDYDDASTWHDRINDWIDVDLVTFSSDNNLKHISSSYIRHCNELGLDTNKFIV